VFKPSKGDVYVLLYIDHHDAAYRWAENRKVTINPVTGAMQMVTLVVRSTKILTNYITPRSHFFQRKTTGAAFISSMPFKMRVFSSATELTRI
jgi:hypothetical protein